MNHTVALLNRHVGTAGDDGKVRIRFAAASLEAGTTLNLDYLTVEYAESLAAELAKVPKSDSTVTWNATALASINAEVDTALNTAIPGSPTANSINERVAAIDDLTQASGAGDLAAILVDTGTDGVLIAPAAISTASFAAGAIDAAAIASNAVGALEIADGAITAAKIANAAIDQATFAADVYVVANVKKINDTTLTGNGGLVPWGPA